MPETAASGTPDAIRLTSVRVHNLQSIDVAIPLHRLTVITGVSGSGKSSLAFDTLYAEGQRRYIESFSPYARQFLERLDKPDADRIENLPPAVALRQNSVAHGKRSTVATATELYDYLRLLFAKAGRFIDPETSREIRSDSPQTVAAEVASIPEGRRLLVAFEASALPGAVDDVDRPSAALRLADQLLERGYTRIVVGGQVVTLGGDAVSVPLDALVVVDRLVVGRGSAERLHDSLETAFESGDGHCVLLIEGEAEGASIELGGQRWTRRDFNRRLVDPTSGQELPALTPPLFSFRSPLGACPTCGGFGSIAVMSWDKLVPDRSKSLREGAIVAWTTPAYRHELDELLELAPEYKLPVDVPFDQLLPEHLKLIHDGVPRRRFGGLKGFFRWLERKRYKIGVAAFLARFRSYEACPDCRGARLNGQALAVQVAGRNIAELCAATVFECSEFFDRIDAGVLSTDPAVARAILPEIKGRLASLQQLGLGYLTLDRPTHTLSGGEARRVALTAALGANLVNMLYVLDEPSTGLHPRDRERVIRTLIELRDAPNTVVVVEHDRAFIQAADWLIDLGPGAGRDGGRVLYMGPPAGLATASDSITAKWLAGPQSKVPLQTPASPPSASKIVLSPCSRHNLKDLTVEFPLNQLCVVSGVSGSGKSTLVLDTLYPAVRRAIQKACDLDEFDRVAVASGAEQIDDVLLIDQSPIGRTSRSNPATYLGAFDAIRAAFAETPEAKLRNFTPGTFSFNSDRGGRCPHCRGAGMVTIDMQFLPDIEVTCPECRGTRFRRDVLEVKLRGKSIAEVLAMTAAEAFVFFARTPRIQRRLAPLREIGLEYLPLGQPATALSGGESQRLRIATFLGASTGKRTLFLFDEPTVGLHAADVAKLLECFRRLIGVGHSIVVVEHRLDVIRAADWLIDLGPEAGPAGGEVIAAGPPSEIARVGASLTGKYLRV